MKWIKRNLFFLLSTLVALALIGAGGWYFHAQYQAEGQYATDIEAQYETLKKLSKEDPHPGKKGQGGVDNVQAAQDQKKEALALADKLRASFQRVNLLDNTGNFQRQLDGTVRELTATAKQFGVGLPAGYSFTFQAESKLVNLPQRAAPQLSQHLAEIKAICDILFAAKINSLDNLQREMMAGIETNGPDFLPAGLATNASTLAEMTPYKVGFHCFSGELASVLESLASSPHGFVVKFVDVDPGSGVKPGAKVLPPGRGQRPVTFLNENLLGVTLLIEVVKPKPK